MSGSDESFDGRGPAPSRRVHIVSGAGVDGVHACGKILATMANCEKLTLARRASAARGGGMVAEPKTAELLAGWREGETDV